MTKLFKIKKRTKLLLFTALSAFMLGGCGNSKENILIYSSGEDYKIEYMNQRLQEEFPNYNITIEYISTGNHAAKLLSEGTKTECDITHDLDYGYLEQLAQNDILADLSAYSTDQYTEDVILNNHYLVECRVGGAAILNTKVLEEKGLPKPESYKDLLNPQYRGLISMANPKASGSGYMFLKSLANAWGEEQAFEYFKQLTPNILQYTSSGSGPVNALIQEEVAIGLGMTGQAVLQINEGHPLEIVYFEEGSPYNLYGQSIIKGKENRESVKEIFDFIVNTLTYELVENFFPEKIYNDIDFKLSNFPENIVYSDMSNNNIENKNHLLNRWEY